MSVNPIDEVTVSFTGTGSSDTILLKNMFAVGINGTFVGTVDIERDLGSGFIVVENGSKTAVFNSSGEECGEGALYRFTCSAYTSGTAICTLRN